jgi:hypothetical protein
MDDYDLDAKLSARIREEVRQHRDRYEYRYRYKDAERQRGLHPLVIIDRQPDLEQVIREHWSGRRIWTGMKYAVIIVAKRKSDMNANSGSIVV